MESRYKNKRLSDMKDKQLYEAYPTSFLNEENPVTVEQHVAVLGEITRLLQSILHPSNQEPTLFTEYLHEEDLSDITMFITEKYYGISEELKMRKDKNKEPEDYALRVDRKYWKLLPADRSRLIRSDNGILSLHDEPQHGGGIVQACHLYLLSNDKVREGDWFICDERGSSKLLHQCIRVDNNYNNSGSSLITAKDYAYSESLTKKVIATTDKTISTCSNVAIHPDNTKAECVRDTKDCCGKIANGRYKFPQIPESFVNRFVNKQGQIGTVTLEHEEEKRTRPHRFQPGATIVETFFKIKLNSKGEIIVK